jgi:adenosylmethionine-8-amino-7-oxononanoate aminotransferase
MEDRLIQADLQHVWHPFTQHSEWEESRPLVIQSAVGAELIDTQGNRYLDGVASLWVGVHGHQHPVVDGAIRDQLARVAHTTLLGLANVPAVELAETLARVTPGDLSRVFYSDCGSAAVEIALKMAFQYQRQAGDARRTVFARFEHAYHGDTLGAVSVGGIDLFHQVFGPLLFDSVGLPTPLNGEDEDALADEACRRLDAVADTLCAIIVEPLVQAAAGMRMHSARFLDRVLGHAKDLGAMVILDEVATGLGRTGTLFAAEQLHTPVDILCLGKGLSNGYLPLAATLTTERVYEAFVGRHDQAFFHGHSFTGNPLGCAAARACLQLFDDEDTLTHVRSLAESLRAQLAPIAARSDVAQVRQTGLMVGIDLLAPDGAALPSDLRIGHRLCLSMRARGVVLRPLGDTLVLMPPLCLTHEQLDRLVRAVVDTLDQDLPRMLGTGR